MLDKRSEKLDFLFSLQPEKMVSLCGQVSYLLAAHCGNVSLFLLQNSFAFSLLLLFVLLWRHVLLFLLFSLRNRKYQRKMLAAGSYFASLGQWGSWLMILAFRKQLRITSSFRQNLASPHIDCLIISSNILTSPPTIIVDPYLKPYITSCSS